jgi:aerobic carbon-monoxide dehydrogenase large subunit
MNERNAYFGSPVQRLEDLRLLRGRGCYIDDVYESGELHAVCAARSRTGSFVVSVRPRRCGCRVSASY